MKNTMLAGVYNGTQEIELLETKIPEISADQALLKVMACGICGTDLRILRSGHRRIPEGERRILGHELAGEIVQTGDLVSWPLEGTRVSIAPNMGCGYCDLCVQGQTQLCENYFSFGVVIDGGFAEYMLIPAATIQQGNISELSPETSYEAAAMIEPLACVYRGLMSCRPEPGESALVVGVGPIGLMFLQLAKLAGLEVIVSSRNQERNQCAREYGADLVFNPQEVDFQEAVLSATGGKGVDIVLVAAPSGEAQTAAIEVLNHQGRINFFGGLPKDQRMTPVDANLVHYKELTITGTTGSTIIQYRTVKKLVERGKIDVEGLITNRFSLSDIKDAFQAAKSKTGLKTMVFPNP